MPEKSHYKVVVIGSGPAGLTATIYAARANLDPLVIEGIQPGGQLTTTTEVENYPGFEHGIQGPVLMDVTRKQAERFGAEIARDTVTDVAVNARPFALALEGGGAVTADALIIASGASAKYLGLPNEQRLLGYGVSACATCDGFFQGKEVVVVGGDTAMEEATFLTKFPRRSTVHRRGLPGVEDHGAALSNRRSRCPGHRRRGHLNEPAARASRAASKASSSETRDQRKRSSQRCFAAIGHKPNTDLFRGKLEMNDVGYLKIQHPLDETSVDGVFAAGDVADFISPGAVSRRARLKAARSTRNGGSGSGDSLRRTTRAKRHSRSRAVAGSHPESVPAEFKAHSAWKIGAPAFSGNGPRRRSGSSSVPLHAER
jgi:thioredoxin reductase (NADPH)